MKFLKILIIKSLMVWKPLINNKPPLIIQIIERYFQYKTRVQIGELYIKDPGPISE